MYNFFKKVRQRKKIFISLLLLLTIPLALFMASSQQVFKERAASKLLALKVVSNHLVDSEGQTIRLIGINREAGIGCVGKKPAIIQGPTDQTSVQELTNWHIN